ncbi:MAG: hypothetical protein F6J87_29385 [Spirulina sp. SIO3F2]|nr:hypothetical protein [Spirulina sp. SIO3F2]
MIKGWCRYFSSVCSSRVFSRLANLVYLKLRRWAKRRHVNKFRRWIARKY